MREILFRGIQKDNGEWIEGYYVRLGDHHYILTGKLDLTMGYPAYIQYDVIPETLGRYTGLTDKNGRKVFEGDIIKHFNDLDNPDSYDVGTVLWDDHRCRFFRTSEQTVNPYRKHIAIGNECTYEVIGNIHDNPELLKGE